MEGVLWYIMCWLRYRARASALYVPHLHLYYHAILNSTWSMLFTPPNPLRHALTGVTEDDATVVVATSPTLPLSSIWLNLFPVTRQVLAHLLHCDASIYWLVLGEDWWCLCKTHIQSHHNILIQHQRGVHFAFPCSALIHAGFWIRGYIIDAKVSINAFISEVVLGALVLLILWLPLCLRIRPLSLRGW